MSHFCLVMQLSFSKNEELCVTRQQEEDSVICMIIRIYRIAKAKIDFKNI